MPARSSRPCRKCGRLTTNKSGMCDAHELLAQDQRKAYDKQRGTATQRGYTSAWARYSKQYRLEHPLCVECLKEGKLTPATCVDHIIPHKGDMRLFWDESNWRSLCTTCHNKATASKDGGFGNPVKDK